MSYLITFEGIDGCGKTTQIGLVSKWITNRKLGVIATKQPGGTALGLSIRELVTRQKIDPLAALFLFSSDRIQHINEVIKPSLDKGLIVLCDRYIDSTMAYQCYGNGIDPETIRMIDGITTKGVDKFLTIWLDLDVRSAMARMAKRGNKDLIEQSSEQFHKRVRQGYLDLAMAYPDRIKRIDAALSPIAVFRQIQSTISMAIPALKREPCEQFHN